MNDRNRNGLFIIWGFVETCIEFTDSFYVEPQQTVQFFFLLRKKGMERHRNDALIPNRCSYKPSLRSRWACKVESLRLRAKAHTPKYFPLGDIQDRPKTIAVGKK